MLRFVLRVAIISGSSEELESGVMEIVAKESKVAFIVQTVGLAQKGGDFVLDGPALRGTLYCFNCSVFMFAV